MHIYVFGITGIIIIFKEKSLEDWSIIIVWKVSKGFCLVVFKDLEILNLYHLVLAFYMYLIDGVSVVSYNCFTCCFWLPLL